MNSEPSFGTLVKERRNALGLTQFELGRRVGCAAITIRKIEADALRPSVQVAENLALQLKIPKSEQLAFIRLGRATLEPSTIPVPPPMPEEIGGADLSGSAVRGFKLGERLGMGGCGAVYRAVQTTIKRDVVIKIIFPSWANQPDFIRQFEAEAQQIARLEHPHIAPLYDFWREPGGAYLVMPFFRGGSLQKMLEHAPLQPTQLLPLLEQVCAGLHAAHRAGIIHRNLKPSNILLDSDGNVYLSDFSIARNLQSQKRKTTLARKFIGSPAYIAPEQILDDPVSPQSDIYLLGITLFELMTGQQPFTGETDRAYTQQHLNRAIPLLAEANGGDGTPHATPMDMIIERATAKDPSQRYPDVLNMLADIRKALMPGMTIEQFTDDALKVDLGPPTINLFPEAENPYKGLRPFGEADSIHFFGRETLIQTLLARMAEETDLFRFLAVIGPSGSGKSSVVRAGLIPALRQGGLPGSENWFIVELQPGAQPFEALETGLKQIATHATADLLADLRQSEHGLLQAVNGMLATEDEIELVLVIDQFEEIFTHCTDGAERAQFLESLVAAVLSPDSRIRIIITLRADFTDRPLLYADFGELVRFRTEFALPLTTEEMTEAICKPAERVGLALEPGLPETIIGDLGEQPGSLPLLQYTLTELFNRRVGNALTLGAYQQGGGVRGALASRADALYTSLDEPSKKVARHLFLRLVTPSKLTGDGLTAPDTRRRVLRSELDSLMSDASSARRLDEVIALFGRHRMLTFDHDPATRAPTVEVAHEALIREWQQLQNWLDEDREFLLWQQRLRAALYQWKTNNQDEGALLRGAPLTEAENWFNLRKNELSQTERRFIQAGIALRATKIKAQEDMYRRDLESAQKLAETERNAASRLRMRAVWLAGALVVAAMLAVMAGIFGQRAGANEEKALAQEKIAVAQKATAEAESAQRAAAEAEAIRRRNDALVQVSIGLASQSVLELQGQYPERSLVLALEALDNYPYTWQAENALGQAVMGNNLRLNLKHQNAVNSARWSADETRILTASEDGTAKIWDALTGEEILTLPGHGTKMYDAQWSPDESLIVTEYLDNDNTAEVWDAVTGELLSTLTHPDWIVSTDWSPDGTRIVTAGKEGTAKIWDATTGKELFTLSGHSDWVNSAHWSPDGKRIATASDDGTAKVWDALAGTELFTLTLEDWVVRALWSPDGNRILTAGGDGLVKVWDALTGEEQLSLPAHTAWVLKAEWSPDGTRIVTLADAPDTRVRVWDAITGEEIATMGYGRTTAWTVAWSPSGAYLVTGGVDTSVLVWNPTTGERLRTFNGHASDINWVVWSADESRIMTASDDGTAKVWDANPAISTFAGLPSAWSPNGDRIAGGLQGGEDGGTVKIWDTRTGEEIISLKCHPSSIQRIDWSPDGMHILTVSNDEDFTARVWDVKTGEENLTLAGHSAGVFEGKWSPDGKRIATGSFDTTAKIWDAKTGAELLTFTGHQAPIFDMVWSPDGAYLATTDWGGAAKIWNAETGEIARDLYPDDFSLIITGVAWSPDGKRIATYADDGVGRIWDVATGQELTTFTGVGQWLIWSKTGQRILGSSPEGVVRIWNAETGDELLHYNVGGFIMAEWSPDETRIAVGSSNGTLQIFPAWQSLDELVAYAHECCVIRELTPAERKQFGLEVK